MEHIAIFGGSFDPPTLAHQAVIEYLTATDWISEVWVMPSAQRPDKPEMSDATHRLAMAELIWSDIPSVRVNRTEIDALAAPTNTYKTWRYLKQHCPSATLWWVIGSDVVANIRQWAGGEQLYEQAQWIVLPRPGYLVSELPPNGVYLDQFAYPRAISSTGVRQRVKNGTDTSQLVANDVATYILRERLYT